MRVFVLSPQRCGSVTFSAACSHIKNFTSGHETREKLEVQYPDNHIEVDNRLAFFLGRIEKNYGDNAYYVFLKRGLERNFIEELKKVFDDFYPEGSQNDYTSMVNVAHYKRINEVLADSISKGAKVTQLGQFDSKNKNLITPKVLTSVNDKMLVMKEEIFGPLLPVLSYDNLREVTEYINNHDRPLGLYFFGNRRKEQKDIIENTRSGGVTINDAVFHLLQSRLPFGGVGESGYGFYHGYEGFLNFSNLRSIYHQTNHDTFLSLIRPPRGKYFKLALKLMNKFS